MSLPGGRTPRRKAPSLKKSMMMDVWRGVPRVRKWPSPRGPAKSSDQRAAQDEFSQASDLIKLTPAVIQLPVIEAAQGTPFYPRDLLMMAMFGRLWAMKDRNGRLTRTRRMNQDVSLSLDLITDQIGARLTRGPTGWIGTIDAANFASWQYNKELGPLDAANSTSPFAFKGGLYRALRGQDIFAFSYWAQWDNGAEYQAVICRVNASRVIQEVIASNVVIAPEAGLYPLTFDLAAEIIDNTTYALMVGRIDAAPNFVLRVNFLGSGAFRAPWQTISGARLASVQPAVGQTIDNTGGGASIVPCGALMSS